MELNSIIVSDDSNSSTPEVKIDYFPTKTSALNSSSSFTAPTFPDHPKSKKTSQKPVPDLSPFSPDSKPSQIFLKTKKTTDRILENSNFGCNNLPFLQDINGKKDSIDTWASSDSKILNKFSHNFSRPQLYLRRFNDSTLFMQ